MAHVVGVPRRDPCQKCKLPVFLAERLTVGKKVYHRTCLKCARCRSQLTPGSFYETEVDDEYCCETCPDEEQEVQEAAAAASISNVQLRIEEPDEAVRPRTMRSSIADRLAFFEQSKSGNSIALASSTPDAKLLQKSVSDEEKSKSLKKMEAMTPYKLNSALSSFLHDTVDSGAAAAADADEDVDSEATSSAADTASNTGIKASIQSTDSEEDEELEDLNLEPQVPQLPQTPAPIVEAAAQQQREQKFTATAQMNLSNHWNEDVSLKIIEEPESSIKAQEILTSYNVQQIEDNKKPKTTTTITKKTEIQLQLATAVPVTTTTTTATIDSINNNDNNKAEKSQTERINIKLTAPIAEVDVDIDDNYDNVYDDNVKFELETSFVEPNDNVNYVTKEETIENKDAIKTSTDEKASDVKTQNQDMNMDIDPQSSSQTCHVAEENNVELRTKSANHHSPEKHVSNLSPQHEDVETTKRLSVVRARLHQFEVIANNNDITELDKDKENKKVGTNVNIRSSFKHKKAEEVKNAKEKEKEQKQKQEEGEERKVENQKVTEAIAESIIVNDYDDATEKSLKQVPKIVDDKEQVPKKETPEELIAATEKAEELIVVKEKAEEEDNKTILQIKEHDETPMELEEETAVQATVEEIPALPSAQIEVVAEKETEASQPTTATSTPNKSSTEKYPVDLNPFGSDDDDDDADDQLDEDKENQHSTLLRTPASRAAAATTPQATKTPQQNLNPFDSSDDEIELEKSTGAASTSATTTPTHKVPPPRPPPPRLSRNPFGEDTANAADEDANFSRRSSLTSSLTRKTPVPTPRTNISQSQNPTPEPTPRLSNKTHSYNVVSPVLHDPNDYYGSANSLSTTPHNLYRNSDLRGSNNSLASSAGGTIRSRKQRRAPAPPTQPTVKELFPSPHSEGQHSVENSQPSTPSSSTVGSPKQGRKKRPAPAPPKPARLDPTQLPPTITVHAETPPSQSKNSLSYPLQSELDSKLSDEEKALLEGNLQKRHQEHVAEEHSADYTSLSQRSSRRLIPLDASLLLDEDGGGGGSASSKCDDLKHKEHKQLEEELNVVYRRVLVAPLLETPTHEGNPLLEQLNESHDRQLEKLKDNKEAKNRNRQSQISIASSSAEDSDPLYNKSSHGKWKRRKGPAPALPIPPRKVLQMLPLQEIKHELDIIEVQQQGLEKQGVVLEKMIRDRCEGENGEPLDSGGVVASIDVADGRAIVTENSKEVEDLILQLFELVNEKNELFRRQAELMYLRRQHRLEQEQADIEYEIRVLMAQPERNKTDTDKAREEALIARLVEVVQLRNEVVECLEMDRLREAEEDMSIKKRLELHTAQREGDENSLKSKLNKLSKKEKKKQKETKKLEKSKKLDADKDADESELNSDKQKVKKKKKKLFF